MDHTAQPGHAQLWTARHLQHRAEHHHVPGRQGDLGGQDDRRRPRHGQRALGELKAVTVAKVSISSIFLTLDS